MTITIREIQPTDNAGVAAMIRGVFDEYNAITEGTVYTDPTTDHLHELFQVPKAVFYVAEKAGRINGCCGIYPTKGLPQGCAELVKYYVSKEIRGTGIGRKLFEKCEIAARNFGYGQLYIESMPDFDGAVRIYEKIGFTRRDSPLGNSGHFGCNIWMTKKIQ